MPVLCESRAKPCGNLATLTLSVLAPTGETIADEDGEAPVLREVLGARLCATCAAGWYHLIPVASALGGHVDHDELRADDVLELDGLTLAKFEAERALVGP